MFGEIYDVKKFVRSLDGVVKVVKAEHTDRQLREKMVIVRVPTRTTKEYISSYIEPIFKKRKQVRLVSQYPSLTLTEAKETDDHVYRYACLIMFGSLELQPELQALVNSMVKALRFLSWKSSAGKFIAMDLKVEEVSDKLSCQKNDTISERYCYGGEETGQFLKKIGFGRDTTVYLTETGWHGSLQKLREYFPNTFTKVNIFILNLVSAETVKSYFENLEA